MDGRQTGNVDGPPLPASLSQPSPDSHCVVPQPAPGRPWPWPETWRLWLAIGQRALTLWSGGEFVVGATARPAGGPIVGSDPTYLFFARGWRSVTFGASQGPDLSRQLHATTALGPTDRQAQDAAAGPVWPPANTSASNTSVAHNRRHRCDKTLPPPRTTETPPLSFHPAHSASAMASSLLGLRCTMGQLSPVAMATTMAARRTLTAPRASRVSPSCLCAVPPTKRFASYRRPGRRQDGAPAPSVAQKMQQQQQHITPNLISAPLPGSPPSQKTPDKGIR